MRSEDGLLLLSASGTIEWANQAAADMLCFSREELKRMAVPVVCGSDATTTSLGPVASAFQAILSGAIDEAEGDARFPSKPEKRIAVHWKLWALPNAGNERQVLLSISETAQAHAEGLSTSGYRDVFEHAVEGIFRTTLDGQFLEMNPALARIHGYATAAEMMQAVQDIDAQLYVSPERRAEFKRLMDEQGVVNSFESEVYTASGEVIWIAEYARLVRGRDGRPLYYEGSVIDISKRKRAEEALKRSEEKFRHLVEMTNVVPWEADFRTGTFTYVGPQAAHMLGCTSDECLQPGFWEKRVHREDRDWVSIFRQEAIENHRKFECEYRFVRPDGEVVWVREIVSALPSHNGSHLIGGFLLDITHRRQAEESLKESQHLIEQIASASPTILYLYDPLMGRCLYLNGQVRPILGYSRQVLREMHPFFIEALTPPEEFHAHHSHFQNLRQASTEAVLERHFRMRSAAGNWVWIHSRECVLKRDSDGLPTRVVGTLQDITLHRKAIEELEANQSLFRRLAETTNVIPFDFDSASGRFIYIGPQAERLFDYPLHWMYTEGAWLQMLHQEDIVEGTRFAAEAAKEVGDYQCDFRVLSADGRVIWVRQVYHREWEGDRCTHARGFLLDITESKRLEEEREQSRAEIRELAARNQKAREEERVNIAREIHDEMGQALTMMKLELIWTFNRLEKASPHPELDLVRDKLAAMEQLISSTLQTVRRVISALRPPLLEELGLADAIEWHAKEFARRTALRCEIEVEPAAGVPIDTALALFRIFQEITTNIARHAKATRVTVELRATQTTVVLLVIDNGCGIPEWKLKKKGHFGLLGMQERAWAVGGQLWVESSPGKGTSVRVEVPFNSELALQTSDTPESRAFSAVTSSLKSIHPGTSKIYG